MANQLLLTVDKGAVQSVKDSLRDYINKANAINPEITYVALRRAEEWLQRAKAIHKTLKVLDLLDEASVTEEDLERTENKLRDILEEKRRKDIPKWRS